jgi:hypothetical protein
MSDPDAPPAILLLDDPTWPMPQPVRSWRSPDRPEPSAPRRLRVWRLPGGTHVAVITERGPGMSVTNVAALAYAALAERYADVPLRVIEHYPPEGPSTPEHFDEILVEPGEGQTWRHLPLTDVVAMLGVGVLDPPSSVPDPATRLASRAADTIVKHEIRRRRATLLPPAGDPGPADDVVLHGHPGADAMVLFETSDGDPIAPLPHVQLHSPTGFGWGYGGSGPADLARCILIAVLGGAARCPTCDGTGAVMYVEGGSGEEPYDPDRHPLGLDDPCWDCEATGITILPSTYQAFKRQVVVAWPGDAEWRVTAGEVRAWLTAHQRRSQETP